MKSIYLGAAAAMAVAASAGMAAAKGPNVVPTGATLVSQGTCTPGQKAMWTYRVTIKNIGDAAHVPGAANPATPGMCNSPHVTWCGIGSPAPKLLPGQSTTVIVNIPIYPGPPTYMTSTPTHDFLTVVFSPHDVAQSTAAYGPHYQAPSPKTCTIPKVPGTP